jgi:hypothetical protein
MNPADVGSGVVSGGSEYVWAAYVLSWVVLVGYALSLKIRQTRFAGDAPAGGER